MIQETKGQVTKNNILREGLMLASVNGLINISIGSLAAQTNMSRSGLFAHFLSKEQLQVEIIEYAYQIFYELIMRPCEDIPSPTEKLHFLKKNVHAWYEKAEPTIPGGCIFMIASLEFDDRPGRVRDLLHEKLSIYIDFIKTIHDQAIEQGEFAGHTNRDHFAYVFYSLYMGFNQYKRFLGDENAWHHYEYSLSRLIRHAEVPLIQD